MVLVTFTCEVIFRFGVRDMDAIKEKISIVLRKKVAKLKRFEKKKEKNRIYYEKNCVKLIK